MAHNPAARSDPQTLPAPQAGQPGPNFSLIDRPLWEFGLGGTGRYGPDYPASDEYHFDGLAAPIFIYRGDIFRVGDDSVAQAVALDTDRIELGLSFDASFRADSDDNDAREGMSDLDYLGELGPQFVIHAAQTVSPDSGVGLVDILLPVRAVFSTDFRSVDSRGFIFQPGLRYKRRFAGERPLRLRASVSAIWATEALMDYFYEVRGEDARPDREEFDANDGYLGSELRVGVAKEIVDRLTLFLTSRLSVYSGAENRDSPLFTSELSGEISASFVWSFWRSEEKVSVGW